jgi:heat shock protein HslJ
MHTPRPLFAVGLAALLVAACAGSGAPADPQRLGREAPTSADLSGRTFLGVDAVGRTLVPGTQVRLAFVDDQLSAQAGCNTIGGAYRIDGSRLAAGPLATTEMACEPALMDQDRWLAELLGGATVTLEGDTLTLAEGGVALVLQDREVADPDRPLLGTRWVVDGLVSGEAVASLPLGVTAALTFRDGRVDVEAGCNTGRGGYAIEGAVITFEPLMMTMMACEGPATDVERSVLTVLAGSVTHEIEADTLRLSTGALGLVLRAEP